MKTQLFIVRNNLMLEENNGLNKLIAGMHISWPVLPGTNKILPLLKRNGHFLFLKRFFKTILSQKCGRRKIFVLWENNSSLLRFFYTSVFVLRFGRIDIGI